MKNILKDKKTRKKIHIWHILREADETESEIFNINKKISHNRKVILELEKEIKDLEKLA